MKNTMQVNENTKHGQKCEIDFANNLKSIIVSNDIANEDEVKVVLRKDGSYLKSFSKKAAS